MLLYEIFGENISQREIIYAACESDAVAIWKARKISAGIKSPKISEIKLLPGPYSRLMKRDSSGIVSIVKVLPRTAAETSAYLSSESSNDIVFWAEPI